MAYDVKLADRVREYLRASDLNIEEKKMFGGLAFMINGKMCINVSGERLMCRFDPVTTDKIIKRKGFEPMIMKGKKLNGYCYVKPEGFVKQEDFKFWIELCRDYNPKAKASKSSL